ncbi:hypothetical protein [Parasediminibacterium sp. JCM 36343]|uniref:hypothetical protein n=1 Tax=Parasediminibacterium sp. JCM 36343 TaxID=3374279 RepID=UPI00397C37E5
MNNKEIDDILNSLDGMSKAEAPFFFQTRLLARLQQRQSIPIWQSWGAFLAQPAFAIGTLSLFLVLNMVAINKMVKNKTAATNETADKQATLQNFVEEYDLSTATIYSDAKNN